MIPSDKIIYRTKAWAILSRSYESNRIAGTYLFYGPDGVGRWLLAVCYTALINCEEPQKYENEQKILMPCKQCKNCHNIFSLNFEGIQFAVPIPPHNNKLDEAIDLTNELLAIKREEPFKIIHSSASINIPISIVREIKKNLSLRAVKGLQRVVLFYQMEKMRTVAADALLKLIEEPPDNTVIILITRKPDSLLPTIQSRAQKIKVDKNKPEYIKEYINEKYDISDHKTDLLSRISEGSLGQAIDIIETSQDDITSKRAVIFLLYKSLFLEGGPDILAHMNDVLNFKDRGEADELLRLWQLLIRDCAHFSVTNNEDDVINIDFLTEIKKLASFYNHSQLACDMTDNIKITLADLKRNVHIQGALMALALRLKSNIKRAG